MPASVSRITLAAILKHETGVAPELADDMQMSVTGCQKSRVKRIWFFAFLVFGTRRGVGFVRPFLGRRVYLGRRAIRVQGGPLLNHTTIRTIGT